MMDKGKLMQVGKILVAIQFLCPIMAMLDAVGFFSIPAELVFILGATSMALSAMGISCIFHLQKVVKEEEDKTRQKFAHELEKAKRKEETLMQLLDKQKKNIEKQQRISRKKQRGRNKSIDESVNNRGVRSNEKKEKYPYKEAGENSTKFITGNVEGKSDSNKVLIVDDSMTSLKLLSAFLKKMNIEARLAKSGKEALEAAQREEYALILMDHMMKGKNGLETVREIRQLKGGYYQNIPIVDVLSMGMEHYEVMLNKDYYQAYLTKPIDFEMLQQVMITYGIYAEN